MRFEKILVLQKAKRDYDYMRFYEYTPFIIISSHLALSNYLILIFCHTSLCFIE